MCPNESELSFLERSFRRWFSLAMDLKEIMAVNLRRIRHDKQMTQEELADRAGLNRKYPSLLENEHYAASVDVLEKLATALDVDPVELFRKNS